MSKVSIDRDRDGWYYVPRTDEQVSSGESSTESARVYGTRTYDDTVAAAIAGGHEIRSGGWRKKLLSWNFTSHALDGYPGWEIEQLPGERPAPAFVKLTHVRGPRGSDVESSVLANAWDDVAEVGFYQRDWTDDGIPWVSPGDTYWSGWWFATVAERDRFLAWKAARS